MADRENVIERLGRVSYYFKSLLAIGWQGDADIYREHMESVNMARTLLKEQEAVRPERQHSGGGITWWYVCGNCRTAINPNDKFCHECGKAVKWDE